MKVKEFAGAAMDRGCAEVGERHKLGKAEDGVSGYVIEKGPGV